MSLKEGLNYLIKEYPWPTEERRTGVKMSIEQYRLSDVKMSEVIQRFPRWDLNRSNKFIEELCSYVAEAQLDHPVSRPCKECGGKGRLYPDHPLYKWELSNPVSCLCPTCKGSGGEVKKIVDILIDGGWKCLTQSFG